MLIFLYKNRLNTPLFSQHDFSSQIPDTFVKLTVNEILNVNFDFAEVTYCYL